MKQMERDEKDGPKGRIRSVVRNFVEEVVGQRGSEQYRAFLAEKCAEKVLKDWERKPRHPEEANAWLLQEKRRDAILRSIPKYMQKYPPR